MIEFNIKELKPEAVFQKNNLYRINENRVVQIHEKHDDSSDVEVVNLEYDLKEKQYAIFGNEYRPITVSQHGCKTTDVLTCLIDDENKIIYSLILDIKRNISAFSDNLFKDNAMLVAINEVRGFIEQLYYANLHKNSFLLYHKDIGYTETLEVGIATKNFEERKFLKVADFLEGLVDLEKPSHIQPLVWYKFKTNLMPYVSEVNKIKNFSNRIIDICGNIYQLQVYILKKINDSEYAVTVKVKQSARFVEN